MLTTGSRSGFETIQTEMNMLTGLRQRARRLKAEVYALYLAYRDPRVPWYARLFAAGVVVAT